MLSDGKVVLYEEKDALLERYAAVKGSWEDISSLEQKKVRLLGTRRGSFGTWALLDRESVKGQRRTFGRECRHRAGQSGGDCGLSDEGRREERKGEQG